MEVEIQPIFISFLVFEIDKFYAFEITFNESNSLSLWHLKWYAVVH